MIRPSTGRARRDRADPLAGRPSAPGLAFGLAILLLAGPVLAQQLQVQVGRGPHYVGVPIEIQVVARDFESSPAPEIVAGELDGARLRQAGVSDSSSTSITIVNGRIERVREVSFVYRFELTPSRAGRLRVPPFRVRQGGTQRTTRAIDLTIERVPTTRLVSLSIELPERAIFVGEKVPVGIELRVDREAQRDLLAYRAEVPLFDLGTLRFLDAPDPDADTELEIETTAGTLRLPAVSREEQEGGRSILVLRARRTLIASEPGVLSAAAPRVLIERGTRFRRDLFNQRQAVARERRMAEGEPVDLEVLEVPRAGRPESFAGAVGEGFSLEVSADRSVVQLGEPIRLRFTLRGDGDLSMASLPPLDAPGLFDPERFRLPEEPPPGVVDEDGKHFEVDVRVLDADVREIPALEYSWFDAGTRRFETTASRPIALSVGAAEVIGAEDVARADGSEGEDEAVSDRDASLAGAEPDEPRVRRRSLAEHGANLAVETDPERVLAGARRVTRSPALIAACYAVGLGLLVFAGLDRRRLQRDPRERARERLLERGRREVEAALSAPDGEAAAALGRALRGVVAALPESADAEVDALIAECDALRFAPGGEGRALPGELAERARRWVAAQGASTASSGSVRPVLLLLMLPIGGALATAAPSAASGLDREAVLASALEAYAEALAEPDRDARLAGFARAERGFAALVEDGVETPALWTNLGNAALQAERPGHAILAYHRALLLDPGATTARQNLVHARSRLPDWVPRPEAEAGARSLLLRGLLDAGTRALVAAVGFVLAAAFLAVSVRRRKGAWRGLALLSGGVWAVALGSLAYDATVDRADVAVVVADGLVARVADSPLAPRALPEPLPAGVEVRMVERRSDWARARLANGREVWLRASGLAPVDG